MNKDYWKEYSGMEWGKYALYCNTGNGEWALFKNGVYLSEGPEHKLPKWLMKHYKASSFEEDPYPREAGVWFYLNFKTFEDLMRMVWDIHTGKFLELWGEEPKKYESCIGYLEGKEA